MEIGRKRTQRTQKIGNSVGEKSVWEGEKWEKAVGRWLIEPPFPGKSRHGRRKWLISRL